MYLDTYGRNLIRRPGEGVFVMAKHQMDELIKKTNGNVAEIELALGIAPGDWQKLKIVRIDVPDVSDLNLRMPRGTEQGANSHWNPGGKTPSGI